MNSKDRPEDRPKGWVDLFPALPVQDSGFGELRDLAGEVMKESAALEGAVALKTARAIGEKLRLLNSYYSNLIEGHKTYIPDIEAAMVRKFSADDQQRYAQELCVGHVEAERRLMAQVMADSTVNVSSTVFLCTIHKEFYAYLPKRHLFTHSLGGFTTHPVKPGVLRDLNVSLDSGQTQHGPEASFVPELMACFKKLYDPAGFHGDEKVLAAAAAHLKLAWIHPFRDGNGRVARLYSGLFLARIGINRSNLWSLSRGFSHDKAGYMQHLGIGDPQPDEDRPGETAFMDGNVGMWCEFFLNSCLDQIRFMGRQLGLHGLIGDRIDLYVHSRSSGLYALKSEASRLLRAVFLRGEIPRGEVATILNMPERSARRLVSELASEGLLVSATPKGALSVGLPLHVLPFYFPELYDITNFGAEYLKGMREGRIRNEGNGT